MTIRRENINNALKKASSIMPRNSARVVDVLGDVDQIHQFSRTNYSQTASYSSMDTINSTINYKNIFEDDFSVQGITNIGDEIFISAYAEDEAVDNSNFWEEQSRKNNFFGTFNGVMSLYLPPTQTVNPFLGKNYTTSPDFFYKNIFPPNLLGNGNNPFNNGFGNVNLGVFPLDENMAEFNQLLINYEKEQHEIRIKDKYNSRLYVYDNKTGEYEGKIILDNKAHVGGVTYDSENNNLIVSGSNGSVYIYDYDKIKNDLDVVRKQTGKSYTYKLYENDDIGSYKVKAVSDDDSIIDGGGNITVNGFNDARASTLYYYKNKLYVASFSGTKEGELIIFDVETETKNNKKTVKVKKEKVSKCLPRTQGIAVTEYDNSLYVITTQSLFAQNSVICVTQYDENDQEVYRKVCRLNDVFGSESSKSGAEGISIKDGYISIVHEKYVFNNGSSVDKMRFDSFLEKVKNAKSSSDDSLLGHFSGFIWEKFK